MECGAAVERERVVSSVGALFWNQLGTRTTRVHRDTLWIHRVLVNFEKQMQLI